ncbi:MAG: diaminopimelate decarboxylase [Myxococcota bacterium]|nr:diaminopimelate decarboxylase [Myxococcota bacterium]
MKAVDAPLVAEVAQRFGTPVYLYDAAVIRARVAALQRFDVIRFAQKACSNTHILRLMRELGVFVDAVSIGEVERARRAGYSGAGEPSDLVYTADMVTEDALGQLIQYDISINAGSADMLEQLGRRKRGHRVWLRVNPGFGHGHSRKTNTGGESSKHGIWHEQLDEALKHIDQYGLDLVGLHMHIGSGADFDHLRKLAAAMVAQVEALRRDVRAISCGGGLPIPYIGDEAVVDVDAYFEVWDEARHTVEQVVGHAVSLEIEPGRYLVAESGKLVARVRAVKMNGRNRFAIVDAGFNDLMRPVLYGSHHEISLVRPDGSEAAGPLQPTLVGGPLCESGDVFTQREGGVVVPRDLPEARVDDLLVLHDTGAYAAAMASNYNSRPLAPEVLVDAGEPRLIRRRQTIDDLLALEEDTGDETS